jgi:plastocyanin
MNTRAVFALAALLAAGCTANDNTTASPASAPAAAAPVTSSEVTGTVPKNAIVTLLPAGGAPPMPASPAVLDQISKQFLPNVLMARVGQAVEFRNSEDMPHNVSVTRRLSGTEVFNVSTEPHQQYVHTFDRVGQYDVRCDIHEGMEATIIVARGPITTIAQDDGRFSIPNVALGAYTASVTFQGQTVEQPLDVNGARTQLTLTR